LRVDGSRFELIGENMYKYIWLFSLTILFGQYDYSLEDLNSASDYYGESVGTSFFPDQVTLHYFGHYN
jgi:hypothetical protein